MPCVVFRSCKIQNETDAYMCLCVRTHVHLYKHFGHFTPKLVWKIHTLGWSAIFLWRSKIIYLTALNFYPGRKCRITIPFNRGLEMDHAVCIKAWASAIHFRKHSSSVKISSGTRFPMKVTPMAQWETEQHIFISSSPRSFSSVICMVWNHPFSLLKAEMHLFFPFFLCLGRMRDLVDGSFPLSAPVWGLATWNALIPACKASFLWMCPSLLSSTVVLGFGMLTIVVCAWPNLTEEYTLFEQTKIWKIGFGRVWSWYC